MFANDNNEKNIKTYANLLQNIREGKEGIDEATSIPVVLSKSAKSAESVFGKPKNAVHAQAHQHSKVIHTILDRYDPDHPSSRPDGSHLQGKTPTELSQLEHHHTKLANIHRAHATMHEIHGNHDAVALHRELEDDHNAAAEVSNHRQMRGVPIRNRESHEDFDNYSSRTVERGDDALKNHPITTKMVTKIPKYKPDTPGMTDHSGRMGY